MKKIMMIAATSTTLGCLSTAHAQSSVTLYGVVDAGLTFNSNAKGEKQYAMTSGNASGSRWGFRGNEDLGGGLSTFFRLEGGFSTTNGTIGQGGTLFGRGAYVGLASKTYGAVSAGRQATIQYDFISPYPSGGTWAASGIGYGTHLGDLDGLDNFNRINSSLKYVSPSLHGLQFGADYSFGGVPGQFSQKQTWGLGAQYLNGPLALAVAFNDAYQPNFSFFGSKANDSATANNMTNPAFSGYATARTQQIFAAAGQYVFGKTTFALTYTNTRFTDLGSVNIAGLAARPAGFRGTAVFNIAEGNLMYQLTPALQLALAYTYTHNGNADGVGPAIYHQVNVGADYFLSKRTDLFIDAFYQRASGTDSTGGPAVAAITGATASDSNHQLLGLVGIRHKF
ncbi:porin [Paraburkholderia caballeronis]|uniref:Outer membrane protein (Porin) n=1 Tax=Paraburkholderia caballeronis TaxID=416943 RepID=A0A1H7SXX6_9BURK|nr:porin [Paraburkholderia caballeronis]PXW25714.1 putative porin [Paraburkholderia caballeronis]PXX01321.1 putative porin [Paraburkholderia caballeronis]RAJ99325.1 putative porin [Paraburkholderia caballeronis]SEE25740.1 Outer membrane protein (porin) [Paraburkholderia caballeronis]SEL77109.1 Outer membrane protein (porin) [Paraburkholderia caballeronis]